MSNPSPSFSAADLARWTGGRWLAEPVAQVQGFTQDTRQLRAGQVFVALQTEKRDGHAFLPVAEAAGASAALVSRAGDVVRLPQLVVDDPLKAFQAIAREHRQRFHGRVVGVSGSCGKTSTKNLLARLLGGEPRVLATEGNLNNHIGVPLTLTRLVAGTHDHAVIEAGISGPGEMDELARMIAPDHGIITLVAPAHTEELGGIEGVAREKAVLLRHVRRGGLAVFPKQCWDFPSFRDLAGNSIVAAPDGERIDAPRVAYFAVTASSMRTQLTIDRRRFELNRVSNGMAQNAVLAILLASELGVTDEAIQRALAGWQPAKWRGEFRREGGRLLYLDFYNANPASMADALETFYAIAPESEPRLLVLGCMEELGREAARYHRELGRSLKLRAQDHVFVIGSEAAAVIAGALDSGAPAACIEAVTTLEPVAARIAEFSGAVFVKGSRRHALEKALPAASASDAGRSSPVANDRSGMTSPASHEALRSSTACGPVGSGPTSY